MEVQKFFKIYGSIFDRKILALHVLTLLLSYRIRKTS